MVYKFNYTSRWLSPLLDSNVPLEYDIFIVLFNG